MIWDFELLIKFVLIFTRAGIFLFSIPIFAGKFIPKLIRTSFSFLLAFLISPFIQFSISSKIQFSSFIFLILTEILIGFLMGLAIRMIFFIVEFAGQFINSEMGLSLSSEFNPMADHSSSAIANLFFYLTVILFFISGLHYSILLSFLKSFQIIQPGAFLIQKLSIIYLVNSSKDIFIIGLQIAGPIIAVNFLVNVVFSVLGKVVPKMNVFILSFPLRILAGFGILLAVVLLIVKFILNYMNQVPEQMLQFIS